jgi:hypothetical protein
MLSKSKVRTTALALTLLSAGCSRLLPWRNEPVANEVNLAFRLERNLIELQSVRIDNRPGRFILGTATLRTVVDSRFPLAPLRHWLHLSERDTLRLSPTRLDLGGTADAIIGAETWRRHAITIDYRGGLVTYQKQGIRTGLMTVYRFEAEPMIYVTVDGRQIAAIVDTSSPDTLPAASRSRGNVRVNVAGTDFGSIDVQYANVPQARIGNRLLSRFLVSIDYGARLVGVWRDPRIAA